MLRLPPFLKHPLRRQKVARPPGFGEAARETPPGFGESSVRGPWSWQRRALLAGLSFICIVLPLGVGAFLYQVGGPVAAFTNDTANLLATSFGTVRRPPDIAASSAREVTASAIAVSPDPPRFETSDIDAPEWSSKERVNIMLLGTDRREDDPDVTRTDTVLIVSIDPVAKTAGVLSLPRDLWVNIPGYGYERINTAFAIGEYQKAGGGPLLLRRTLEGLLGVPMHHFALVGFSGFRKVVDQLGGVIVDVERPFRDDEFPSGNYGTRRIIFQEGLQRLDGETALWYVRSRHADSDFGRNRRQRQFLLAIRQQALQLNMIPKAPAMLASVMDSVKTDLRTTEILSLVRIARDVETSRLVSRAIDESMVTPWVTPGGAAVLLPDPGSVRQVVKEVFGAVGKLPTLPVARPQAPVPTPDVARATIAIDPRASPVKTLTSSPTPVIGVSGSAWTTPSPFPTPTLVSVTPAFVRQPGVIPTVTIRTGTVLPGSTVVPGLTTANPPTPAPGLPVAPTTVAISPTSGVVAPTLRTPYPAVVGSAPTVVGSVPTVVGSVPTVVGSAPTVVGSTPTVVGSAPTVVGSAPTVVGSAPTVVVLIVGTVLPVPVTPVPAATATRAPSPPTVNPTIIPVVPAVAR